LTPTLTNNESDNSLLIAVNLAGDTCDRLEQAVKAHSGRGDLLRCPSYISTARRPFFLTSIKAARSSIVFIDFDRSPDQAMESAQYLTQAFPGKVTVVALTSSRDPGNILNAMRAGCSEFLNLPLQPSSLAELMNRVAMKRNSTTLGQSHFGSVISMFGVKGGVGTSSLATHFAVYLAYVHKKRTLLIDNHLELGHVAIYLDVDGSLHTFYDVVRNVDRLDSELLQGFLGTHCSGLHVLTSVDSPSAPSIPEPDAIAKTLDFLRGEFDYIIVDCDIRQDSYNGPFVAASQRLYLITTPEVSAIRDLSRYIDRFALDDPSLNKIGVVLNKLSDSDAIQVDEVEKSARMPIAISIPADGREFVRACNLGEPLYPGGRQAITVKLSEWAAQVAGTPPTVHEVRTHKGMWPFRRSSSHLMFGRKGLA
jgi:pilus assembly protein CpaE